MSDYANPHAAEAHHAASPISIGWVVLASVICGIGVLLTWAWLYTFDWLFFPGIALTIIGTMMFFSERAGLDHA